MDPKAKYRATNAKHWCQYCRTFVPNNDLVKRRHDASSQHQEALKRFVGKIQKEERDKERLLREYTNKSGIILQETQKEQSTTSSFYKQPAVTKGSKGPVPLLSVKPATTQTAAPKALPGALPINLAESKTLSTDVKKTEEQKTEKEKLMAQAAIVGQWESVEEKPEMPEIKTRTETTKTSSDDLPFVIEEKILPQTKSTEAVSFVKRAAPASRHNIRK